MSTKKITQLAVIETPYGDLNWGPDPNHVRPGIFSDIQYWNKYRELDDYKLCHIYENAGVPYSVKTINYAPLAGEEVYITLTRQISDETAGALNKGNVLLLTGGYCKDCVAVCGGIQRALGADKKVGIVYLDAHSDMSTPSVTRTGILGGMDLSTVLGIDMDEWRLAAGLKIPFDSHNVILSDFREACVDDDGALPIVEASGVNWIKGGNFENLEIWTEEVARLAAEVDAIYLHIDADILNRRYAPNAACAADGGPSVFTVMNNIKTVMETGKVLVYGTYGFYFDTDVPGQDSLTLSGLRIVSAGLNSWRKMPSF